MLRNENKFVETHFQDQETRLKVLYQNNIPLQSYLVSFLLLPKSWIRFLGNNFYILKSSVSLFAIYVTKSLSIQFFVQTYVCCIYQAQKHKHLWQIENK